MIYRLYITWEAAGLPVQAKGFEVCVYIETTAPLIQEEMEIIKAHYFHPNKTVRKGKPYLRQTTNEVVVEIGPQMHFPTQTSSSKVSTLWSAGIRKVTRVEEAKRFLVSRNEVTKFIDANIDGMLEMVYEKPLDTFATDKKAEKTHFVPVFTEGRTVLEEFNKREGLGMDVADMDNIYSIICNDLKRDPTNVELTQFAQGNSNHCRHHDMNARITFEDEHGNKDHMQRTLFQMVKSSYNKRKGNNVIAFHDDASAIKGKKVKVLFVGKGGFMYEATVLAHPTCSIETHNHPSGFSPFPGSATGKGSQRDIRAVGRGGFMYASINGYVCAMPRLANYTIPGEEYVADGDFYLDTMASPEKILVDGTTGITDYCNKSGEPLGTGYFRMIDLVLPSGERFASLKPTILSGDIGMVLNMHSKKMKPRKGMVVVQIGGPQYRVGVGGGGASSQDAGAQKKKQAFASVQRGDPENSCKGNELNKGFIRMGVQNPVLTKTDQGAGGPSNAIMEISNPAGVDADIRQIKKGDKTLSDLETWIAEAQERDVYVIWKKDIPKLRAAAKREGLGFELIGPITGTKRIRLTKGKETLVDLPLEQLLGKVPQKHYTLKAETKAQKERVPFVIPTGYTFTQLVERMFARPDVSSKKFITRKSDQSVGGRMRLRPECGVTQIPINNCGLVSMTPSDKGAAIVFAVGEKPMEMLVSPEAGIRLAVAEMLWNMCQVYVGDLSKISVQANLMAAFKYPGQAERIYKMYAALTKLLEEISLAIDGGKDSMSMLVKLIDKLVPAPMQAVLTGYALAKDQQIFTTPDLKEPGDTSLLIVDPTPGMFRMGGSALAYSFGQIGNVSPDMDDPKVFVNAWKLTQELIKKGTVKAFHDTTGDGGLVACLAEMAMASNVGFQIKTGAKDGEFGYGISPEEVFMCHEPRAVIEVSDKDRASVIALYEKHGVTCWHIGGSLQETSCTITHGQKLLLREQTKTLRGWWERTSDEFEKLQRNFVRENELADIHIPLASQHANDNVCDYKTLRKQSEGYRPKVVVLRMEGTNGHEELFEAYRYAGYNASIAHMFDLRTGKIKDLRRYREVAFAGGFSRTDVFGSGMAWANEIIYNPTLNEMFTLLYGEEGIQTFGVCNGFQVLVHLNRHFNIFTPNTFSDTAQPFLDHNKHAGKVAFVHGLFKVGVRPSPAVKLRGMEGSQFAAYCAHGEGNLKMGAKVREYVIKNNLAPLYFADEDGEAAEHFHMNPNGSTGGLTALTSLNGEHFAMMPHFERCYQKGQLGYVHPQYKNRAEAPCADFFFNGYKYAYETR